MLKISLDCSAFSLVLAMLTLRTVDRPGQRISGSTLERSVKAMFRETKWLEQVLRFPNTASDWLVVKEYNFLKAAKGPAREIVSR